MIARISVELEPFQTPNFVRAVQAPGKREDGMKESQAFPLSAIDSVTLDKLCREFTEEVFRKAGKEMLPQAAPNAIRRHLDPFKAPPNQSVNRSTY